MKKTIIIIIIILSLSIVVLIGFMLNRKLDLPKIADNLNDLKVSKFSPISAYNNLNTKDIFEEAKDISNLNTIGINETNIFQHFVKINSETNDMYYIIEPHENKKEEVKTDLKKYFDSLNVDKVSNRKEIEKDNFLIYLVSDNNEELLDIINDSNELIYTNLNLEPSLTHFNLNEEYFKDYKIAISNDSTSTISYFILKPHKKYKKEVKEIMAQYFNDLDSTWYNFLPMQQQFLKNRLETEYKGYLIYIISSDNDAVLKTIKKN